MGTCPNTAVFLVIISLVYTFCLPSGVYG